MSLRMEQVGEEGGGEEELVGGVDEWIDEVEGRLQGEVEGLETIKFGEGGEILEAGQESCVEARLVGMVET